MLVIRNIELCEHCNSEEFVEICLIFKMLVFSHRKGIHFQIEIQP